MNFHSIYNLVEQNSGCGNVYFTRDQSTYKFSVHSLGIQHYLWLRSSLDSISLTLVTMSWIFFDRDWLCSSMCSKIISKCLLYAADLFFSRANCCESSRILSCSFYRKEKKKRMQKNNIMWQIVGDDNQRIIISTLRNKMKTEIFIYCGIQDEVQIFKSIWCSSRKLVKYFTTYGRPISCMGWFSWLLYFINSLRSSTTIKWHKKEFQNH